MSSPFYDALKDLNIATTSETTAKKTTGPKLTKTKKAAKNAVVKVEAVDITPDSNEKSTVNVEERKQISRKYVVDFQVNCKNFYWHEFENDAGETIAYWQCGFQVEGGYFNFHIFDRPETKRKDTFRAVMSVWKKKQSDGRTHIYIDMRPTDRPVTHRIRVWRNVDIMRDTLPDKVLQAAQVFKGQGDNRGCFSFTAP